MKVAKRQIATRGSLCARRGVPVLAIGDGVLTNVRITNDKFFAGKYREPARLQAIGFDKKVCSGDSCGR